MEGELNGNILRCSDGHKYYRHGPDRKKTKLYFKCAKYRRGGCRVIIQTNYTGRAMDHLRVFNKNEPHNHVPTRDSHHQVSRLSSLNINTCKARETSKVKYASGGGRKSVVKKEDVNTCKKAQANSTPMHDQDVYPSEEQEEDLEEATPPKYARVMEPELDIFNKPAQILVAGASNSGKSYLVSRLIQRWYEKFERIVVIGSDWVECFTRRFLYSFK